MNLVDFDALWGHRRNTEGYGHEIEKFDKNLGVLLEQLKKEAGNSEKSGRCRVSLSAGSSCLRKPDGSYKTIGDWKYEADQKLYENKKKEDFCYL